LKDMYCPDNGHARVVLSMMFGASLLQFNEDVSDGEAVERLRFDLHWKVALNLPLDYDGCDASSFSRFRTQLIKHKRER
jgi:hypothetical protein